ncbi:MAG TPA: histidine kinase [Steroidobacteraceae bacterium]|nr:histidine kinase [Steroidobacteraceae bacterium]
MPRTDSVEIEQPRPTRSGFLRLGIPLAINWALLVYALTALAIGGAYTALRVRADYQQTLEGERVRLRAVTAALHAASLAMLYDGVGAALAAANEARAMGGLDAAPSAALEAMLQRQLTGGAYVRALFLADSGRFVLATRDRVEESVRAPAWLRGAAGQPDALWVGAPTPDPQRPGAFVIPIAERAATLSPGGVGWTGALFSFDGFDKLFEQFGHEVRELGLVSTSGRVLVSIPKVARRDVFAGIDIGQSALFRSALAQGASGVVEGYGTALKTNMIYGYALLKGFPIYIAAGQSREEVLAGWRERRRTSLLIAAGFGTLVIAMTALLSYYVHALRIRERDYRTLFNNARFSVFLLEGDRFVDANRTAASMFGLPSERSAIGLGPWQISPEWQPSGERSEDLARKRIATALREGGSTFAWQHKRLDTGELFPAEVNLSSLSTGRTTLALAVVHDVTARTRAEQDLRLLSAELMRLQDEERRRIGRELHDSTGQSLAALEIELARLMRESAQLSPDGRQRLELCARLASQCSAEIRTASYLLHPPLLDELGLLSALRWLADGFSARSGIEVRLDLPQQLERLSADEELALFRVAQEALTNVHRHTASPWVRIGLQRLTDAIALEIEDGGSMAPIAFTAGAVRAGPPIGVGLAGMRERVRQLGGEFAVEATASGTRVRASIPVARADRARVGTVENRYAAGADTDRG